MFKNLYNISFRVTLLSLTLVVISSAIIETVFYKHSSEALVKLASSAQLEHLNVESERLKNRIETLRHDVVFLSHIPPIAAIIDTQLHHEKDSTDVSSSQIWKQRLAEIFSAFLKSKKNYFQVRFIGVANNGKELVRVQREGVNVVRVPEHLLQEKGGSRYFKEAITIARGNQYLSDVNLNREHDKITKPYKPVLRAAIPVHSSDGSPFGIIIINMDFSSILNSLSDSEDEISSTYVTNDSGDLLAGPENLQLFGFEFGAPWKIQDKHSAFSDIYQAGSRLEQNWEILLPENDLLAQSKKIFYDPSHPQRYLVVINTTSYSWLLQQTIETLQGVTILSILLILVAAGTAYWLSHLITKPLTIITTAVDEFAKGDATPLLPTKERGEIGLLSKAFRKMTLQVQERNQQLRQSENYVRKIVDNIVDGLIIINKEGVIKSFNPAAESIFGFPASEVIGDNITKLMPQPYRKNHQLHVNNFRSQKSKVMGSSRELNGLRKDGSQIPIEVTLTQMDINDEAIFIGLVRDLSSRKKSDAAIRLSARVMDTALEGILVTDHDNNITVVNRAFSEITGYTNEEIIGQNPRMFKSGKHDEAFYQEMWLSIIDTGAWQGEIWDKRKGGEVYPKWMSISCIKNEKNEITNYVAIFSDITERKSAEEHMINLAHIDTLTSLPNRRLFHDRLERSILHAQRNDQKIALFFIDLDNFKQINDAFGHDTGDEVLIQAADRFKRCTRENDTVARFAGDEFTIILGGIHNTKNASLVGTKIVNAFSQPFKIKNKDLNVDVSIGISMFDVDAHDSSSLLEHADVAMYHAKEQDSSNFQFYVDAMNNSNPRVLED